VLKQISRHIDFEGIANHRGSAFGRDSRDLQPGVIDWENQVSIEFLKLKYQCPDKPVFIEDEGRQIGRISIPENLFARMRVAPRAVLQLDTETRLRLIGEDYILNAWPQYQLHYGEHAQAKFSAFVLENLARIQKRLGGERYIEVKHCFESALSEFFVSGQVEAFYDGIAILLERYYDPMYRYQLANKEADIIFEGPESEYLQWVEFYLK
ncbi:MAG: tRNA 2-selenouridine(34) synthase MnmH, partial [Aestuariibacter sp.]|nr:tRNA 2-selenouridine(34) synthase MnmH [Aestuariibacter sp.]